MIRNATQHARRPYCPATYLLLLTLLLWPASPSIAEPSNAPRTDAALDYPKAPTGDAVDVYHGHETADPFRWMEDLEAPQTRRWMETQDRLTESFVERIGARPQIAERITAIRRSGRRSLPVRAGSRYFFTETSASASQPRLMVQEGLGGEHRVLFDPRRDLDLENYRYGGRFSPSQGGALVSIGYTRTDGKGLSDMRILDASTGEMLDDRLTDTWSAAAWTHDRRGFFYVRLPPRDESDLAAKVGEPRIYFHRLGSSQEEDRLIYERPDRPDWLLSPRVTADGRFLVISLGSSSFAGLSEQIAVVDLLAAEWTPRTLFTVGETRFSFEGNRGTTFWFQTTADATNRRLIAVDLERPQSRNWRQLVAEDERQLASVSVFPDRLVIRYREDVRPEVDVLDWHGKKLYEVELPTIGLVGGPSDDLGSSQAFFMSTNLFDPGSIYRLDTRTGAVSLWWRPELAHDPDAFEIRQVFYPGRDGTRIPMFLAGKKGFKPGTPAPVFIYGYGTLGWAAMPWYQPHIVAWLEMGGLYALPGVRGGGEYGEPWRKAGAGVHKQTGIDDYNAAAAWLIEQRYTSPRLLIANGGSASGVLAAAAVMQRPELYAASIIDIPRLDMLRYHQFTGAKFVVPEFGTAEDPEEYAALRAYSPYHNIESGTCYPPMLVMVGELDATTPPFHGYKFIARMQADACDEQISLLKVMWGAGHNYGTTPEQASESWADAWAFVSAATGLELDL